MNNKHVVDQIMSLICMVRAYIIMSKYELILERNSLNLFLPKILIAHFTLLLNSNNKIFSSGGLNEQRI